MAEPSLSEILNAGASASPELGTPATVIDSSQLIKTLNDNARFKAENDWRKYNTFLENKKEILKDGEAISQLETAPQDREVLRQKLGEVMGKMGDNPRAFFGGQDFTKLMGDINNLRSLAMASKQNYFVDSANREHMLRNPELNTPENQKRSADFWKKPLGERSDYMLDMPAIFDAQELMKNVLLQPGVQQKFAHSSLTDASGQPGNEFIRELEGTKTSREAYLNAWKTGWTIGKDKYGHSIQSAIVQQFNQLSDAQKQHFGSPENYYMAIGAATFNSDKDIQQITKDEIKGNPNLYKAEELKLKKEGVQQRWAAIGISERKLKDAEEVDLDGADAVLNAGSSLLSKGTPVQEVDKNGNVKDYLEIGEPDLLKEYSTLDKDGKTTLAPDVIRYDKDKDQFNLVYFKRKKGISGPGDIITHKGGGRSIERSIPIDSRAVLSKMTKTMFPNKDIGKVNEWVNKAMNKSPKGLWGIHEKWNQPSQQQQGDQNQQYKQTYKYGNKSISLSAVEKAAKASNMTVDEYIKQAGLQ